MSAKPLVLVDGTAYLYRAFHALPALTTSAGEPTGAIHGVLNMLRNLVERYEPERMAFVFDAPGKTFRDDLYARYKATRPPMPDDLRAQIEPLLEAVDAMGIPVLRITGVEADDVIGTLATHCSETGQRAVISTSDKDMTQLVDEYVEIVNTMTDQKLDTNGVKQKFGVAPDRIVDFLTLVGDTSDNIPGVPGVGPKTAVKWLDEYGDLDNLCAHADEIGGKVGERFRAALADLPLYRKLVTIKCDVELPAAPDELVVRPPDPARLRPLLERLEMHSTLARLCDNGDEQRRVPEERRYEIVVEAERLNHWLAKIEAADLVALDTETTSLRYMEAELVGIALAVEAGEAAYIPVAHRYPGVPAQLDREAVLDKLKPWLESADRAKVGHHLKYDSHIFKNHGIALGGIEHDSMLESYVLDSTATRHDMDSVAAKYLGIRTTKYEDVAGKGAKQLGFDEVDLETAGPYAAEDADVTLRLHGVLWAALGETPALAKLYSELERPLLSVLQKMEYTGVMVDAAMLATQSRDLGEAMAAAELAAYEAAGGPFNLGSPKQLQEVLYGRLGIAVRDKTPTGQPSTAERTLQILAEKYELPKRVLEYRALAKLKSTYTDRLPREINPLTGRIHTSYHQAVAATGRLSSSDPNLQNIPIRTPEGRRIRQAFVAAPGYRLIAADYSQIELRIMAHLSADEGLRSAFRDGMDIHSATAAEVFAVPRDEVSADQRRSAKAINFGLIYGMSAFGLARQLGIDRQDAQAYVDLYFDRYPGVKRYMDTTRTLAREQGYVSTVFGRRLHLPEIGSRNVQRRQYAERSAINAPMQGTAADIIKRAMLDVDRWLAGGAIDGQLIMQVHDELVLEVAESDTARAVEAIKGIMEGAADLRVALMVDIGVGGNWDEAH
ncbi:DNA polymerase I [Candidatus Rariloculus sp.]|uniref:DNA polymerase I n=1 Tax=Candidatus Rariloculus sp. TaxID=3101265 RepID=UPI003D1236D8